MGDGATNLNTASGMLPATSDSSPYVLTYAGWLDDESEPLWHLFDQIPDDEETSEYTEPGFLNLKQSGPAPDYESLVGLRGVMVDLGSGNAKCFDKFIHCSLEAYSYYYAIFGVLIQGSNNVNAAVNDTIDSANWNTLREQELSYTSSSWKSWITWTNIVKYRYYRVMVKGDNDYVSYNEWAATEFRFVEGESGPEGSEVIFVPGINTESLFVATIVFSIPQLLVPAISIQESFEAIVNYQYIGIDEYTVLLLQMNSETSPKIFIDSSQYQHVLEVIYLSATDEYPRIINTYYASAGFSGYGYFYGYHSTGVYSPRKSDSISVIDSSQFDLGLNNTPFCIDFRILYEHDFRQEEIIISRHGSTANNWNSDDGIAYKLSRTTQGLSFEFNNGSGLHNSILCPGYLIEDYGYAYPEGYYANWHHVAITYDGVTTRMFCDGVEQGTPVTGNYFKPESCSNLTIGAITTSSTLCFYGSLDELRISNGVFRWIADFTIPTESYIEPITERLINVPVISVGTFFLVSVLIIPQPIAVSAITVEMSLVVAVPQSPGFKVDVFDIDITSSIDVPIFSVIVPVQITITELLSCIVLENIAALLISAVEVNEDVAVTDVFLGSKVQVPDVNITILFTTALIPGWYISKIRLTEIGIISVALSRSGQHIFIQEGSPDYTYRISHDFGSSFEAVTPLTLPSDSLSMLRISDNGQILIIAASKQTVVANTENLLQISFDAGVTWAQIGYHWYYSSSIHISSEIRQHNLITNGDCSIIYVNQNPFDSFTQHKNWIRSIDSGATWHQCNTGYALPISTFRISTDDYTWDWDFGPAFEETWYNPSFIYDMQIDVTGNIIVAVCQWYTTNPLFVPQDFNGSQPMFLYIGDGIIVSEDAGVTWNTPVFAFYDSAFSMDETNFQKRIVSVSSNGAVIVLRDLTYEYGDLNYKTHHFISTDTGVTWEEITSPIDMTRDTSYWSISIDPITFVETPVYVRNVFYVDWTIKISDDLRCGLCITEFERIYLSTDYLMTWNQLYPTGNMDKNWSLDESYISSCGNYIFTYLSYSRECYFRETGTANNINSLPWSKLNRNSIFRHVNTFAMSNSGEVLLAIAGYPYESIFSGKIWWPIFGDGWDVNWTGLSVSGSGQIIVATADIAFMGGMLFISNDTGSTWRYFSPGCIELDLENNFEGFASSIVAWTWCSISGDGQLILAGTVRKDYLNPTKKSYISTDAGMTWAEYGIQYDTYVEMAMSYNGAVRLVGYNSILKKYVAESWTTIYPDGSELAQDWCVAVSYDGTIMLAGSAQFIATGLPGRLYMSVNSGVTWSEIKPAGDVAQHWSTCKLSSDGTVIIAGTYSAKYLFLDSENLDNGRLFVSTDSGVTWTEQFLSIDIENNNVSFHNSGISADGSVLYAVSTVGLWTNLKQSSELITLPIAIPYI